MNELRAQPDERIKRSPPPEPAPRRSGSFRPLPTVLVLVVLWFAWPYVNVYRLISAIDRGDEAVLAELVDWPAIRTQIREALVAQAAAEMARPQGPRGFEMLGTAFVAAFAGPLIDNLVTPSALAAIRRQDLAASQAASGRPPVPRPVAQQMNQSINFSGVRWAFPTGPTSFSLVLGDKAEPPTKHVTTTFEFRDWTWKLTRVQIPPELLSPPPRR